jgi:SAM-dependent methyltransferase
MTATGVAGFIGQPPVVSIKPTERSKYEAMWAYPQYRAVAPGADAAMTFLREARLKPGAEVIDFGCGTGRGALMIAMLAGAKVHMLDFASNCLDTEVRDSLCEGLTFTQHDLLRPVPVQAEYGYCTDVMEHLPPETVDRTLVNILQAAQHVFFQISCVDDALGALIGQPLHLSVHPYEWWHKKLQSLDCVIHWSRDDGEQALFYVTAWQDAKKVVEIGALNIGEDRIRENVKANIAAGWQQVQPHVTNDFEAMILAGGPSLAEHADTIKAMRASGIKLITLNGAYNWAVEQGLQPSAQIIVDARPFNARFTKPVVPGCKYLIASQCDPSVLEGLPKELTYLWHTTAANVKEELDAAYPVWWLVPGGSTVMLRAIPLMRMLGYKQFHLFGFDSCLGSGGAHHAYSQPENDSEVVIPVTVGGRTFRCHAWQVAQAQEFMDLVKYLGDEIELEVYGDGLINHIVQTGAKFSDGE